MTRLTARPAAAEMVPADLTRRHARRLLAHEANLAELYGRRCALAIERGDILGARRWNREYRLAAFRCRTLGTLLRAGAERPGRPPDAPRTPRAPSFDSAQREPPHLWNARTDPRDAAAQIDELLAGIRALVCDHRHLDSEAAAEIDPWTNRYVIVRLRECLAQLDMSRQTRPAPPAA